MKKFYLALSAMVLIPGLLQAQALLSGKVMDSKSDFPLDGATIFNRSKNIYKKAAFQGKYSIPAQETDTIIFTFAGYRPDTISVSEELLRSGFDMGLKVLPAALDTVRIAGRSYAQDSLERRLDYKSFYDRPRQNITGGNTPSTGFGISTSPISYFSKKEKAQRRFKKQLEYNEQQAYIDTYFSAPYVHRLTGLTGEELYLFMRTYRPKYKFVRSASSEDMFNYINASLKSYQKKPAN